MDKKIDRADRLRQIIDLKMWKKKEFAEKMHIQPQHVNKYLSGELDPLNLTEQLLLLDVNIRWLITGEGPMFSGEIDAAMTLLAEGQEEKAKELAYRESNVIPASGHFYKVIMSINAGDPAEIYREENYTGEEVFFPYEKSESCFALKVVGDSMVSDNGRSISEGDFVIADMDAEVLNGDIVVIHLMNGRQMVKQYISGPMDDIVLRSSNTAYPDIIVKESDVQAMMRVVGKALYKRF